MTTIKAGDRFLFDYPPVFTSLPDHTAHTGAAVEVIRPCIDGEEYENEGDAMFRVRAADGWEGDAWESELAPLGLPLGTIRAWSDGESPITVPHDATSAMAFLHALAGLGLLYHPEDHAHDCLAHHHLPAATLDAIEANMRVTFDHLPDPCEIALAMLGDPDPIITLRVSPYVSWQGPASEAHKARAF